MCRDFSRRPLFPARVSSRPRSRRTGVSSLVVWRESEGASHSLRAVVINSFGAAVSKPVTLSDRYSLRPQVAFGGGLYLVIWSEARLGDAAAPVRAARLTPSGELLEPGPFLIGMRSTDQLQSMQNPVVAWNGESFLVGWHGASSRGFRQFMTATVTPDGQLGPPHAFC